MASEKSTSMVSEESPLTINHRCLRYYFFPAVDSRLRELFDTVFFEYCLQTIRKNFLCGMSQETFISIDWINSYQCKSGDSLVHVAARNGQIYVLKFLKDNVPNYNFEQANFIGKTPLHEAAQCGHYDCLQYLLTLKIDINCLKKADWTPLMLSCAKNRCDIVKALIDAGADDNLKNKDGWTSFHIACREGNLEIVSFLLNSNPNAWDTISKNGRTPLHTAALHGKVDIVQLLLNKGNYASDEQDCCGTTPLMDAFRSNHVAVAKILIASHKANVFHTDKTKRQSLHHAAQSGSILSVSFLLSEYSNININAKDIYGSTPFDLALKENQLDVVKLFKNKLEEL